MTTFINDGGADDGVLGSTASHGKNGVFGRNDDATPRNAATPEGNGVFGYTQVPDGAGVLGLHNSNGVGVVGFGHPTGIGVVGMSVPPGAKGGDGVLGVSNSEHRNGIVGRNDSTTARVSTDPGGNGVLGFTQVPDGAGVLGINGTSGVGVAGLGLIGISGGSANGVGVMGVSAPIGAKGGDGVQGITNSEFRNGIYGRNESTAARGNGDPAGNGVFGYSLVPDGAGVLGANGAGGTAPGVIGTGGEGVVGIGSVIGVHGIANGQGWAGYFNGPIRVEGSCSFTDIEIDGSIHGSLFLEQDLRVGGDVFLNELRHGRTIRPSRIRQLHSGHGDGHRRRRYLVTPCTRAYDRRAIGVVSGAGTLKPAITLGVQEESAASAAIALAGTVFCLVDATHLAVEAGDLLTCSDTRGHAMKASDPSRSFGAVIGKALAPLHGGCGLIPMVVALQ